MAFASNAAYRLGHEVHGAQNMMKTGVVSPRINQVAQPQLLDPTQALQVRMLKDIENNFVG